MGSAETLLCWGGMVRTPFGWSLSEVDPLQFPNKGIPSAMSIHPVWLPFSSLGLQEEGLDLVASAPRKEDSGSPVKGKGLALGPPQCQACPQPRPPIWQAPSGWQSRACFPGRPFLGVPGEMGEGRGFPWAVCLPPRPLSFRVSISLRNTVAAHGTVFCAVFLLSQASVHGHRMSFHVLLSGRGLPERSGAFRAAKSPFVWVYGREG